MSSLADGGRGGIRTHGTVSRTPVFKTGSLNHSDTLPVATARRLAKVVGWLYSYSGRSVNWAAVHPQPPATRKRFHDAVACAKDSPSTIRKDIALAHDL